MNLGEILKTEVNSGMINFENHNADNGFFGDTLNEIEKGLKYRNYEPLGICKHVPFPCSCAGNSIAFVYKYDEEVYWCHMPETYWFHLLRETYGYNEADKIFESIIL